MLIKITNWKTFQHYKERRPPWIKLHRQLLDKREWIELSADASKMLVNLWIIASDHDEGEINKTADDIAWALRIPGPQLVVKWLNELQSKGFVELSEVDASTALAGRLQHAAPETEERQSKRQRTEKEGEGGAIAPRAPKKWKIVPEEWQPTEKHHALAKRLGVNLQDQVVLFRDHEFKDPKTDADRAFNRWLHRAKEFGPKSNKAPAGSEASRFTASSERSHYRGHAEGGARREGANYTTDAERVKQWQQENREEARAMYDEIMTQVLRQAPPAEDVQRIVLHTLHTRILREKLMKVVA